MLHDASDTNSIFKDWLSLHTAKFWKLIGKGPIYRPAMYNNEGLGLWVEFTLYDAI